MIFWIFKTAVFDTNHSLWKKRLNQFEEKKTWVIFMLFLANFIGIWFDVYSFGFWPTLIDLYGESQGIFVLQGCYSCLQSGDNTWNTPPLLKKILKNKGGGIWMNSSKTFWGLRPPEYHLNAEKSAPAAGYEVINIYFAGFHKGLPF